MTAQLALDLWPTTAPSGPGIYAWSWEGVQYRGRIAAWSPDISRPDPRFGEVWVRLAVLWRDGDAVCEEQVFRGMVPLPRLVGTWR